MYWLEGFAWLSASCCRVWGLGFGIYLEIVDWKFSEVDPLTELNFHNPISKEYSISSIQRPTEGRGRGCLELTVHQHEASMQDADQLEEGVPGLCPGL